MPRVSIGLPVYNGENFVREALDSLLAQTFEDFELIISDNASTDGTQEICREYAAKDQRIRYYRNDRNIGAAPNFNRLFSLSTGEYFKWAHHDDVCAPEYLKKCVEVLDSESSAVICHPKTIVIDESGNHVEDYDDLLDFRSPSPHKRFHDYLFRRAAMWNAIWGVIRVSALKQIPLHGSYLSSDQVLLGELVLRGTIYQIPDRLFFRRRHHNQSWRANPNKRALMTWFNPAHGKSVILPRKSKIFIEYLRAIRRTSLTSHEKTYCLLYIIKWGCLKLIIRPLNDCRKLLS